MSSNNKMHRYFFMAGITGIGFLAGCSQANKEMAETRGLQGFINLDAVKEAFQEYPRVTDFEKRVNEIYEGEHLVIFKSEETSQGFIYTAYEDLDKSQAVNVNDDKLFSITAEWDTATLKGYGVNSYFYSSWPYTPRDPEAEEEATPDAEPTPEEQRRERRHSYTRTHYHNPYFTYWYMGRGWNGYYTPRDRYSSLTGQRNSFRSSSDYQKQMRKNTRYQNKTAKSHGAAFVGVNSKVSRSRSHYVKSTGRSFTASRSSSSRSSRGFRSSRGGRGASGFRV